MKTVTKKKSIKITPSQLFHIKEAADVISAMIGVGSDFDPMAKKIVKSIDRFLKMNNFEPREYK